MRNLYRNELGDVFEYDDVQVVSGFVPASFIRLDEEAILKHLNPILSIDESIIAARRYQAEVGGLILNGLQINTDDRSKLLISGAESKARRDPNYYLNWKTPEGFFSIPADQVMIIADAVHDHVQACFTRESELLDALQNGSITNEMLEQGWP